MAASLFAPYREGNLIRITAGPYAGCFGYVKAIRDDAVDVTMDIERYGVQTVKPDQIKHLYSHIS